MGGGVAVVYEGWSRGMWQCALRNWPAPQPLSSHLTLALSRRRYLPPGGAAATRAVGQGTLLARVEALESAMDALLRAQDAALAPQQQQHSGGGGSSSQRCGCCCIM